MHFDESFPKRVAIARSAIGLTQDELAKKVGIVRRQIAAYEGGEARPREKALVNLAAALGTSVSWLTSGKGDGPDTSHIRRTVTVREIPVLSHVGAEINCLDDFFNNSAATSFIAAPDGAGENSFAIEIMGNSMHSAEGVSFPSGTIVTFDPDIVATNGDFVLCSLKDFNETTFKQLIIDQGALYLKPLNPIFPLIPVIAPLIIGVAVHAQMYIKSGKHPHTTGWVGVTTWDDPAPHNEDLLSSRIDTIEEKLDALLELLSGKNPT